MRDRGVLAAPRGRLIAASMVMFLLLAVVVAAPADAATEYYRDSFASGTFSGSTGTVPWSTAWLESEGDGPDKGEIQVGNNGHCPTNPCLVLGEATKGSGTVQREANLTAAVAAQLTFNYTIDKVGSGAGSVRLSASGTGGAPWTTLATYSLGADQGLSSASFNLLPHASPTTRIRFQVIDGSDRSKLNVDDVQISWVQSDNDPPVLDPVGDKAAAEGSQLSFTASASDPDGGDNLTFSLGGSPPAGASITGGGSFTWTPSESQGPGSYSFDVVVTDDGLPAMSDSETITVDVSEVNRSPSLDPVDDVTVDEGDLVTFTATASDPDSPANTLVFSLEGSVPTGASITSGGVFNWTPAENQGGASYTFDVVVDDTGSPSLQDSDSITIAVNDTNEAPQLGTIGDQVVEQGTSLAFTATASDVDIPADALRFSLEGSVPSGAGIDPATGVFSWPVASNQSTGTYTFDVVVEDDGAPAKRDSETISVEVVATNQAPVLDAISEKLVDEGEQLTFTARATDADLPAQSLTYSLTGAPGGASIHPATGVFSWTPSEAQGPGVFSFDVVVTDDAPVSKSDTQTVQVSVGEVNVAPALDAVGPFLVAEGELLEFQASASDPDLPANDLIFDLSGSVPVGAAITDSGVFTWRPSDGQGDVSYSFDIVVQDQGSPNLTDATSVTVDVVAVNQPPEIAPIADQSGSEGDEVALAIEISDPEGDTVAVTVDGLPPGLEFDVATGSISGIIAIGASETPLYTVTVSAKDDGTPSARSELTFSWSVRAFNAIPVGEPVIVTILEDEQASIPLPGSDADDDPLTYAVARQPANGSVAISDDIAVYVPPAHWHGTASFEYSISDGFDTSPTYAVTVVVTPVNDAPVAADDAYETRRATVLTVPAPGILENDRDADGDELRVVLATEPSHGTLSLSPDGGFVYEPVSDFAGDDSFTYRATDGELVISARVEIVVTDEAAITEARSAVVGVMAAAPPRPPSAGLLETETVPLVERSLALMSSASRATMSQLGFPIGLLLLFLAVILTLGRITPLPVLKRGEEHLGTVTMFDPEVGFGLVTRDSDGRDVFVHESVVKTRGVRLRSGDRVRFRSTVGTGRDLAFRVVTVD